MIIDETRLSIIIPCYNSGELIEQTFKSLLEQTNKDFEVICVNDGSTDDTLNRLEKFQKNADFTVNIINQSNKGVSAARNRGILEAKGDYILFLDADDIYHSSYVQEMVRFVEQEDVDVIYCRLSRNIDEVLKYKNTSDSYIIEDIVDSMDNLLYRMGEFGFYCFIYNKEVLLREGILFDENTKYGEDREFNWKYLCHCKNAIFIDSPLYGYRINPNSVTNIASWQKTDLLKAVKRIEKYLYEHKSIYSIQFNEYMYARSMWAVIKTFSIAKRKDLFDKLIEKYDVEETMNITKKDSNILVRISSYLYLIHPFLYYYVIQLKR